MLTTCLQRLPQHFQHRAVELRQLVEEEDAAMRERDFAGPRPCPPPTSPACETVWCGARKGRWRTKAISRPSMPADAVDARHFERLVGRQARQDGGQRAGQQRLAAARRAGHDDVVPARRRDLQRALRVLLAAHFGEVGAAGILPNIGVDGRGGCGAISSSPTRWRTSATSVATG